MICFTPYKKKTVIDIPNRLFSNFIAGTLNDFFVLTSELIPSTEKERQKEFGKIWSIFLIKGISPQKQLDIDCE